MRLIGRHIRVAWRLMVGLLFIGVYNCWDTVALAADPMSALVIGNGAYAQVPLKNPVNDAEDMSRALTDYGFSVTTRINANRREMRQAIREFGKRIKRGGVGLFFYAGHGIQVNGENYLVPIGARVLNEDEVEDECLKASSVLRKMDTAENRLNIIILDACRNNPFARSFRSSQMGLARMDAPAGSILGYATGPGSVAADGSARNGLYTSRLLKWMQTPDLEIGQLFRKVRVDVMAASDGRQVPWESSSLTGEFYFKRSSTPAPSKVPKTKPKTKPEPQPTTARGLQFNSGNIATPLEGGRWNWTVYIDGAENDLQQVKCVEYTLHPTFPNPVRTVCERGRGPYAFSHSTNGWGTFRIGLRVFLTNGNILNGFHELQFK